MVVAINNPALNTLQQILIYDIEIDGELLNLTSSELKQVVISNVENQHESAIITTQLTKIQIDRFIGKPILFKFGPKSANKSFYGYVVSINPNQSYQQDTIVDISCLGPTLPMQSGKPRFYVNRTAPSVFGEIVKSHNLGCQVDSHPYLWPAIAQTAESDWEFIQTLATRLGYCIYIYEGVVRLVNPFRLLQETTVAHRFIKSDDVLDPSRQLLSFNPSTQSLRIRENVKPSYGYFDGINPRLSQPLDITPYRLTTDTPIRDREMADVYSNSWKSRANFWNHQATARINGNAAIVPGVNVSVQISGSSSGRNQHDGTWLVRGVAHSFTNNSFQTSLQLARDAVSIHTSNIDGRWFFSKALQGYPKLVKALKENPPRTTWESSWREVEYITNALYDTPPNPISIPEGMATPVITDALLPLNN
jgi:uncharacterized protein involved in type VI secretion and phage assembly